MQDQRGFIAVMVFLTSPFPGQPLDCCAHKKPLVLSTWRHHTCCSMDGSGSTCGRCPCHTAVIDGGDGTLLRCIRSCNYMTIADSRQQTAGAETRWNYPIYCSERDSMEQGFEVLRSIGKAYFYTPCGMLRPDCCRKQSKGAKDRRCHERCGAGDGGEEGSTGDFILLQ